MGEDTDIEIKRLAQFYLGLLPESGLQYPFPNFLFSAFSILL